MFIKAALAFVVIVTIGAFESARASEVLSVKGPRVEINVTGDGPLKKGEQVYLVDARGFRVGIIRVDRVKDSAASATLLKGKAQTGWAVVSPKNWVPPTTASTLAPAPAVSTESSDSADPAADVPSNAKAAGKREAGKRQARTYDDDDDRTEFFWVPRAGHFASALTYAAYAAQASLNLVIGGKLNVALHRTELLTSVLYSLNRDFAFGFSWQPYAASTVDYTFDTLAVANQSSKTSGYGDLLPAALYTFDLSPLKIYAGLQAGVNLGSRLTPSTSKNGNESSGGMSLQPSVGMSFWLTPMHVLGAKALYRYFLERSADNQDGTSSKITGGSGFEIDGFYELHLSRFYLSALIGLAASDPTTTAKSGGVTGTTTATDDAINATRYQVGAGYAILPALTVGADFQMINTQIPKSVSYAAAPFNYTIYDVLARYEF